MGGELRSPEVQPGRTSVTRRIIGLLDPALGRLALMLRRRREQGIITLYHRVSPQPNLVYEPLHPDEFDRHCCLLKRHFTVIPLSEMLDLHHHGRSLAGLCSITFDDGYLDFRDQALPILEAYGLPASQFVVTRCLETGEPPWDLRLRRILLCSPDIAPPGLFARLNSMPVREREKWLREREGKLVPPGPLYELPEMLRSADLENVGRTAQIGSHTATHRVLGEVDAITARAELSDSLARLRDLGQPASLIAYPRGSVTAATKNAARAAGYRAGFAVGNRAVDGRSDPLELPRFDVTDRPARMLRLELGGAIEPLRGLRTRAGARLWSRPSVG